MKPNLIVCLALVLSVLIHSSSIALADAPSPDTRKVVAANTGFAVELYGKLQAGRGNVFFSPYSISTALAMAYGGARGATAREMAQTLHFDLPPEKLHPVFGALNDDINTLAGRRQIEIAVANSLWPQQSIALLPDYLALCKTYYYSSVTPLDYAGHAEESRMTINGWVERMTNRKIVELLKPGVLDSSTRIILVNAIYFKGKWASPFNAKSTENRPFYTSPDKSVTTPLMWRIEQYRYAEFSDVQVVELPYEGGDVSMLVLLPRKVNGLGEIEAQLTATNLASWTAGLQSRKLAVFLPKFKSTVRVLIGKDAGGAGNDGRVQRSG